MDNRKNSLGLVKAAFDAGMGACNVGRYANGKWQVSVRDNASDGWQIFFGYDLAETIARASTGGPQLPPRVPDPVEFLL